MKLHKDIERVFLSENEISGIVKKLGSQISDDYFQKNLVIVGVLKGCTMFIADLLRHVSIECRLDFLAVSSYVGTVSSSKIKLEKDLDFGIADQNVLLVEDIVDTGNTLAYVKKLLLSRKPQDLKVCTLLSKTSRRRNDVKVDYFGAVVEDEFVVGYGMDYNEKYRNLPYLGVLKPTAVE